MHSIICSSLTHVLSLLWFDVLLVFMLPCDSVLARFNLSVTLVKLRSYIFWLLLAGRLSTYQFLGIVLQFVNRWKWQHELFPPLMWVGLNCTLSLWKQEVNTLSGGEITVCYCAQATKENKAVCVGIIVIFPFNQGEVLLPHCVIFIDTCQPNRN